MFFCDPCRIENRWPESFHRSYGPCELCGQTARCNDVPSRKLPDPKVRTEAEVVGGVELF